MDEILVVDFGGQYCHLIARRLGEMGVRARIVGPGDGLGGAKGLVLSGGPLSVYDGGPSVELPPGVPVLGICYGHQLLAHRLGGSVKKGAAGEYGPTRIRVRKSVLFEGLPGEFLVWMNHRDVVVEPPRGTRVTASTGNSPVAAFEGEGIFGVQFHPEVSHTEFGSKILENFVNYCGIRRGKEGVRVRDLVDEAREKIGRRKAVIGLSGGVDSSTAALLVSEAIGRNLVAVYVDTGLMRSDDIPLIREVFEDRLELVIVDARERFFSALQGVIDPESKRRVIGSLFGRIFEEVARERGAEVLVQGTIYSDRIESGVTRHASTIKSHHNVGGLPELGLEVYEPLRNLYKDEVRRLAEELGLPRKLVQRHVFPGPGYAIRILGEVTPEKVELVRRASEIVEEELQKEGLYWETWQGFAILLPVKSVGIQGDERTYKHAIAIRVVESRDAMTARFSRLPWDALERMATRIANELEGVNRVVYDITNKPPGTIEWE